MKKKIVTIAVVLTMLVAVSGCGQNTTSDDSKQTSESTTGQTTENSSELVDEVDINQIKDDIISECNIQEMRDATADEISFLYDFGDVEYDEIVLSISQQAVSADQITIVKAKSKDDTKEIKKVIDEQLESKKSTFEDYAPEEEAKYDDCEVKINGVYVYAAVCSDNAKAESIFDEAFEN